MPHGVITYAQTGAAYGIEFFIPFLILMVPVAYEGSGHNRGIMVVDCCS
ncbi:hypothetical protein AFERRID_00060 [Acidithiobacillus ferridurans]|uniref:Uncharacterized protein n=2 Tax=root TaxID=1 RepID=A0A2Z6IE27_ACIFI|nr:hypothetical protein AFERRID_00060 [Acidithiobacillus ferridurans]